MHVIIIGGGIAGLSQALSLHQIGVACRVYEAVPNLAPLGYGINLQPNAIRELAALGLGEKLAAAGVITKELAFYNKHGQLIWTEPRGRAAGYRWPQISISRGELHRILLAAIHERLGGDAVVTGHRLTSIETRGEKVIARFADPSGNPVGEAEGDILIGADGIHSAVRQLSTRARRRCSMASCTTAASSKRRLISPARRWRWSVTATTARSSIR